MEDNAKISIGLLTSGGDGPGMNAAVRAVVRGALDRNAEVFAIKEGYTGMCTGTGQIEPLRWESVGGILHQGGTVIGTARCMEFLTREGRRDAAHNLLQLGIDRLIVIGGDGSLTGLNIFHHEWPDLLDELVEAGRISAELAARHPELMAVGLPGSIDNDLFGTDMTIGADTALHRITEAIDAVSSTAASHQRTFVIEVMGRNCGYLALMSALATGADWVFIPENPPNLDDWQSKMSEVLRAGREAGRRDSIVVLAEGARDRDGNPITSAYVKEVLEQKLGVEVRVTVLGHVQRGGTPSAFDRNLGTLLGFDAVDAILSARPGSTPLAIGIRGNRITRSPLKDVLNQTHSVAEVIAQKEFETAMDLRGGSFAEAFRTFRTLVRALPHPPAPGQRRLRLAVMNAGAPAAGMNTGVRAAIRIGIDRGHIMLGVQNGFRGLISGQIKEMGWMSVNGWAHRGGSELGTNRKTPEGSDFYAIARAIEEQEIDGLLIIGGWTGYYSAHRLFQERKNFPAFNIPIVCLPATIDNDLPGSELSIGADTALNNIMDAIDKIKQSAVASRRVFVVEVMGRHCGYLSLMAGLATGAERVYMHEEGVRLADLQADLEHLIEGFKGGKRLGLMIRNEAVNPIYTTGFMVALFEEEGGNLFEVRQAILGHLQQGGDPTPFDRIHATRLATRSIDFLIQNAEAGSDEAAFIGYEAGQVEFTPIEDMPRLVDAEFQRPKEQWWMNLRPIARVLAQPGPGGDEAADSSSESAAN
jgi:6-phosphofructokinase 1